MNLVTENRELLVKARIHVVLSLFLILNAFRLAAQDGIRVLNDLATKEKQPFQEKLYLHIDKPLYSAGETIWIKVYGTIGVENLLSNLSKVVYIELIDPLDERVVFIKIPLVNGLGLADIQLNGTSIEGSYRLRAYSNWMRNADGQFFYDRPIYITNGLTDKTLTSTHTIQQDNGTDYRIQLKNLQGETLSNRPIQFEMMEGGYVRNKKRGKTDDNGLVRLSLDKKHQGHMIRYYFENDEKSSISKVIRPVIKQDTPNVQLFPEGGKLLMDRPNRMAAKVVDDKGLGLQAKLEFRSDTGIIAVIETNPLGMGAEIIPIADYSIRAFVVDQSGAKKEVLMPCIHTSGYSLLVDAQDTTTLSVQLNVSDDLMNNQTVYFVLHHLGKVFKTSKEQLSATEITTSLPLTGIPNGVLTVSVLDEQLMPIAERPVFRYTSGSVAPLSVILDKEIYNTREKVNVTIEWAQGLNSARIGTYSASVVHLSAVDAEMIDEGANILSTLLLSADVKGFIEKPGFYFPGDSVRTQDIDYLMLTQGWRNINWIHIDREDSTEYAVEHGLALAGHVKKSGGGNLDSDTKMQLFPAHDYLNYRETEIDKDGRFAFKDLMFLDGTEFMLSVVDKRGKKIRAKMDLDEEQPSDLPISRNLPMERNDINELFVDQLRRVQHHFQQLAEDGSILIEAVVVDAKRNKASKRSANFNGPGNADYVFDASDLQGGTTLQQCIEYEAIGVQWNSITGNPLGAFYVVDGVPIDSARASMINLDALESIEVLRSDRYLFAYNLFNDSKPRVVFIMTTKPGAKGYAFSRPSLRTDTKLINPQGLYISRIFYKPVHLETDQAGQVQKCDLRTTIHWEPSIVINKSGKAQFDFYTSDEPGMYRLVIEGLDLYGAVERKIVDVHVREK
ncbi:hypothetical protein [Sphingobacterium corticibacterium]|uniref:Macroglobulin domain-containing protein n=1 Tax=Sphingobacterium corticibacterium TaxID=2484746 RepID=A0A4Q6XQS7_9SPHI|nr:hypothetical protein [Sphingobacterium corticibacterium]RZF59792.1 hypothetical protein EWE74_11615 [Sphingobacterium corticibacterium]